MSALRVGFAGTPPFAATALKGLLEAGFLVPGVLTQPDRPAGRGLKLQASAVKQVALQHGLPLEQARSLKLDGRWPDDARQAQAWLESLNLDVLVVAAYGLILPAWVLKLPRLGCLNIHGSLLPRWRGAAPVQRAIEAGDAATGVTIMQMDEGLDTGAMLLTATEVIQADDTSDALLQRLAEQGSTLIVEALRRHQAGTLQAVAQPTDGVTYAHKIEKAEAAIDWNLDARQLERRIRAFDPFPGATLGFQGERIKLWRAEVLPGTRPEASADASNPQPGSLRSDTSGSLEVACGHGWLRLLEVQPAGARRMPIQAFLQTPIGRLMQAGSRLDGQAPEPLD